MENERFFDLLAGMQKQNLSFVVFKRPYAKHFELMQGTTSTPQVFSTFDEILEDKGFIMAPYDENEGQKRFFLKPKRREKFPLFFTLKKPLQKYIQKPEYQGITKMYSEQIEAYKSAFNATFKKAILSKKILFRVEGLNTGVYFLILAQKYPHAFVYYFSSGPTGEWIGASPENFLSSHAGKMQMMSLAGTSTDGKWSDKEIAEQAYVSEYLENLLSEFKIQDWEKTATGNLKAGNVFHLLTNYSFPLKQMEAHLPAFIEALHPTPAVCGLPKAEAKKLIRKVEKHTREYYTGFLGPWYGVHDFDLFVNLRCAKIGGEQMSIFVGGGITKDSVAEKEWDETEQKAMTLLKILEEQA